MQTLFAAFCLPVLFGGTFIQGERPNVRTKHLFVQRRAPLRGSPLPHREILLSEDDKGSKEQFHKDDTARRSRRSIRERRSANPTKTVVSDNSMSLSCTAFRNYLKLPADNFDIDVFCICSKYTFTRVHMYMRNLICPIYSNAWLKKFRLRNLEVAKIRIKYHTVFARTAVF